MIDLRPASRQKERFPPHKNCENVRGLLSYSGCWQSSSIKQLFHNCNRIEAKQQSDTRSKSSTNLILRISIARSSDPIIQSHVVNACLCLRLYQSCSHLHNRRRSSASFATELYNNCPPHEKRQDCIFPIAVSIKPS